MFYLFILESIGTSELLLIGLVALIIFGPRKLPELARMLGKARNEFKRTTDDFKETWVREVDFESEEKQIAGLGAPTPENIIQKTETVAKNEIVVPEIREISQADFENNRSEKKTEIPERAENSLTDKGDWL
jgi:TatA/E family protein of Tat protein translocase